MSKWSSTEMTAGELYRHALCFASRLLTLTVAATHDHIRASRLDQVREWIIVALVRSQPPSATCNNEAVDRRFELRNGWGVTDVRFPVVAWHAS
jgi:hypothetical protein